MIRRLPRSVWKLEEFLREKFGHNAQEKSNRILWAFSEQRTINSQLLSISQGENETFRRLLDKILVFSGEVQSLLDQFENYWKEWRSQWFPIIGDYRSGKSQLRVYLKHFMIENGILPIEISLSGDIMYQIYDDLGNNQLVNLYSDSSFPPYLNRLKELHQKAEQADTLKKKRKYKESFLKEFVNFLGKMGRQSTSRFSIGLLIDEIDLIVRRKDEEELEIFIDFLVRLWEEVEQRFVNFIFAAEEDLIDLTRKDKRLERIRPLRKNKISLPSSLPAEDIKEFAKRIFPLLCVAKDISRRKLRKDLGRGLIDIFMDCVESFSPTWTESSVGTLTSQVTELAMMLYDLYDAEATDIKLLRSRGKQKLGRNLEDPIVEVLSGKPIEKAFEREILGVKRFRAQVVKKKKEKAFMGDGRIVIQRVGGSEIAKLPVEVKYAKKLKKYRNQFRKEAENGGLLVISIGTSDSVDLKALEGKLRTSDLGVDRGVRIITFPEKLALALLQLYEEEQSIEPVKPKIQDILAVREIIHDIFLDYLYYDKAKKKMGKPVPRPQKAPRKEKIAPKLSPEEKAEIILSTLTEYAKKQTRVSKGVFLGALKTEFTRRNGEKSREHLEDLMEKAISPLKEKGITGGTGYQKDSSEQCCITFGRKEKELLNHSEKKLKKIIALTL